MCLYETEIKNIKYLPNKKNKGVAPACTDYRLTTIKTACGWCKECRKKLANEWRIRLYEEIKSNKDCYFVTLSFSPAAINKLETDMYIKQYRGLQTEEGNMETDVNLLAAYAIRMWTERWRKHHKKAPKHFFVTELGHKNSERLHLHGLIWGNAEKIKKTWQYGNVYIGDYVTEKTINYIVKYITKLDEFHKGYKQRIFTSKGMGKEYVNKFRNWHNYKGKETKDTYRTYNGIEIGLPRYYKEKLWTEEQREMLWINKLNENKCYLDGEEISKESDVNTFINKLQSARETNIKTGYGDNKTGNKRYIITELMKKTKEEIKDYNKQKLVKWIESREIDKKTEPKIENKIEKSNNKETIYYGKYKGNTTKAQRNYNELLEEANSKQISVRVLRLIKEGIIVDNFVDK